MARHQPEPPTAAARLPITFHVGPHALSITLLEDWRWSVTVDGVALPEKFMSQVEAWEAGVRAADRKP
jgi:hypothetical protein